MPDVKKCVVLGGSFNPPTRAHRILMEHAMKKLHAETGIYVPSSQFYVNRKAERAGTPVVFTEQERFDMLQAMCSIGISVSQCEYGDTSKGRTLQTLDELQREHPDKEMWFVIGCDKVSVFQRWKTAGELLSRHHLLWVGRDAKDCNELAKEINRSELLQRHANRMISIEQPIDTAGVSSSLFWKNLQNGQENAAYKLLTPEAGDMARHFLQSR